MRIFYGFEGLNEIPNPVLTIGTFDGVHLGHQKIVKNLNKVAQKIGGESVLFTFFPHPRMVLYPDSHGVKLIQSQEEKLAKLEKMGLQNIIIYPFTIGFSRLTALEFVRDFLVNELRVKHMVIGYDHQFGARPLNRAIQKYLEDAIAEEILKGDLSEGDVIIADYSGEGTELTISVTKKEKAAE